MGHAAPHGQLVWVTRSIALNPANINAVFHGRGGHLEVYCIGYTRQLDADELTDEGRALLLPACGPALATDHPGPLPRAGDRGSGHGDRSPAVHVPVSREEG